MSRRLRAITSNRRIHVVAIAALVALLAAACQVQPHASTTAAVATTQAPSPGASIERVVFDRVNADRAAAGLPTLRYNLQLAALAQDHTTYMLTTGDFSHRDLAATIREPAFAGYEWLGENILVGPGDMTGGGMEDAWMQSPDHRANILSPNFDSIGIDIEWGLDGRVWATQNFGGAK